MRRLKRFGVDGVVAPGILALSAVVLLGAGLIFARSVGAAPRLATPTSTPAPLTGVFRNCDFSGVSYLAATGAGSGQVVISHESGTATADVQVGVLKADTAYKVRLIQAPRPAYRSCDTGDPGVVSAVMSTDPNGTGAVTLRGPVMPGATGAWVFIEGPPRPGHVLGDFYTSEVVTTFS